MQCLYYHIYFNHINLLNNKGCSNKGLVNKISISLSNKTNTWYSIYNCRYRDWVIVVLRQPSNFSAISWRKQVNFQWIRMMMRSALYWTNTLRLNFIVLVNWNNSLRIDMSSHSDTLYWFRAIQSLLFLLNAACLAEKQEIPTP
jgi:hypothetical protein